MGNKQRAKSFLQLAAAGDVRKAYDTFVAPSFIHHNQHFKGDRQSLLAAMEEAHQRSPNRSIDIRRAVEEGDVVVTHSLLTRQDPAADPIAVVHIFRFEGERIAELWDIGQVLMKGSPNENGAF